MKKYIDASVLLELFRDDKMLSCDRPFDIYQWAENIIDECPAAENIMELPDQSNPRSIRVPFAIGTKIRTVSGMRGIIESYYIGANGVQRIYAKLENGERFNFTMKGIGKDVIIDAPVGREISRSEGVEAE